MCHPPTLSAGNMPASTKMPVLIFAGAVAWGARTGTPPTPCAILKTNRTCWDDSKTQCMWNATTAVCSNCTQAGRIAQAAENCHNKMVAGYGSHGTNCTDAGPDWVMLQGCPAVRNVGLPLRLRALQHACVQHLDGRGGACVFLGACLAYTNRNARPDRACPLLELLCWPPSQPDVNRCFRARADSCTCGVGMLCVCVCVSFFGGGRARSTATRPRHTRSATRTTGLRGGGGATTQSRSMPTTRASLENRPLVTANQG